jgi:hypothetical protein
MNILSVAVHDRINPADAIHLLDVIAAEIEYANPDMQASYDACNLQPTSQAVRLAAAAALNVLLAHDIGQDAKGDE